MSLSSYIENIVLTSASPDPLSFSKLFSLIDDRNIVREIVTKVIKKFESIPNTGHMQIWLQRSIIKLGDTEDYFSENICKIVGGNSVSLWNNEWLHAGIVGIFSHYPIVDQEEIENIDEVINNDEVLLFGLQSL